ncbi:MerC domain-containing protein [Hyunsoonleella pacifica]|uniref:MerC domain-containing protein n=1 Tax=Hyunsoonleella pacifica TaxID=1080224 RepID=A0A4Q9FSX4_9FLAO|nr:MerC domain-containing protein [Hyunsoonleella pacifica]TBN18800.1 MerC domain-containing protein [Hyunsoonleella pacifica]
MLLTINKSDSIGILSSGLCLIHCISTPFLFAAQAHVLKCCEAKPLWWSSLDIIFLCISALAIYKSSTSVSKKWIVIALYMSWFLLVTIVVNEKAGWFNIPESAIYFPSLSLIFFHWYGSKFCQCKNEKCCVNEL